MWAVLITHAVPRYYYCSKKFTLWRLFVKAIITLAMWCLQACVKKIDLWVKRGLSFTLCEMKSHEQ